MALSKEFIEQITSQHAWQAVDLRFLLCNGSWTELTATETDVYASEVADSRPLATVITSWDAANNRQLITFRHTGFTSDVDLEINAFGILRGNSTSAFGAVPVSSGTTGFSVTAAYSTAFDAGNTVVLSNGHRTTIASRSGNNFVLTANSPTPSYATVSRVEGHLAFFRLPTRLIIPAASPVTLQISGEARKL